MKRKHKHKRRSQKNAVSFMFGIPLIKNEINQLVNMKKVEARGQASLLEEAEPSAVEVKPLLAMGAPPLQRKVKLLKEDGKPPGGDKQSAKKWKPLKKEEKHLAINVKALKEEELKLFPKKVKLKKEEEKPIAEEAKQLAKKVKPSRKEEKLVVEEAKQVTKNAKLLKEEEDKPTAEEAKQLAKKSKSSKKEEKPLAEVEQPLAIKEKYLSEHVKPLLQLKPFTKIVKPLTEEQRHLVALSVKSTTKSATKASTTEAKPLTEEVVEATLFREWKDFAEPNEFSRGINLLAQHMGIELFPVSFDLIYEL